MKPAPPKCARAIKVAPKKTKDTGLQVLQTPVVLTTATSEILVSQYGAWSNPASEDKFTILDGGNVFIPAATVPKCKRPSGNEGKELKLKKRTKDTA